MTIGNAGQTLETLIAEDLEHPLAQFTRSRSRERTMQGIRFSQQADVVRGVARRKRFGRRFTPIFDTTVTVVLRDQARDLGARQSRDLAHISP
jgi:hypothetical protein